jgi:hypothetical protein
MIIINEKQFQKVLGSKLGTSLDRALVVFHNYGKHCGWDITNVLLHATDKKKVEEVLNILEKHYNDHLQFQHPEIRGKVGDHLLGVNSTHAMFSRLFRDTLVT